MLLVGYNVHAYLSCFEDVVALNIHNMLHPWLFSSSSFTTTSYGDLFIFHTLPSIIIAVFSEYYSV